MPCLCENTKFEEDKKGQKKPKVVKSSIKNIPAKLHVNKQVQRTKFYLVWPLYYTKH
jgi:hypothetical protein